MTLGAGSLMYVVPTPARKQIEVDERLIEQTRQAMQAAGDAPDGEVVERALRLHLGRRALQESQALSELSEEQAIELAYRELHAARRQRRRAA